MRSLLLFALIASTACSFNKQQPGSPHDPTKEYRTLVYAGDLSRHIENHIQSTVEVVCVLDYAVEQYAYDLDESGNFIPEPETAVGYKLKAIGGIRKDMQNIKSFGTGIIIGKSESRFLILTSRHIVFHSDTIRNYIEDDRRYQNVMRTQAVLRKKQVAVRSHQYSIMQVATIEADDPRADLALISLPIDTRLGQIFNGKVVSEMNSMWGKLGVIAGYPSEILQVSMGLTSAAPYPGNFGIDVAGTFGFSGGPVFLYEEEKGLAFAGIGRCIPGRKIFHVTPDSTLQFATNVLSSDIPHLRIQELPVLSNSRMYAVNINFIARFFQKAMPELRRDGYMLTHGLAPILAMDY